MPADERSISGYTCLERTRTYRPEHSAYALQAHVIRLQITRISPSASKADPAQEDRSTPCASRHQPLPDIALPAPPA